MKNTLLKLSGIVASLALVITAFNVNSACVFLVHQPELPDEAKKLSKF